MDGSKFVEVAGMSLIGKNLVSSESFVVEGGGFELLPSGEPECRETDLERLLCHCYGGLHLRELTAEDKTEATERDLSQENGSNGAQGSKKDRLAALLKQLLAELMD